MTPPGGPQRPRRLLDLALGITAIGVVLAVVIVVGRWAWGSP